MSKDFRLWKIDEVQLVMHPLGLAGMARGFAELEANPQSADLSHARMACPATRLRSHRSLRAAIAGETALRPVASPGCG
jgi:hypothetical protein